MSIADLPLRELTRRPTRFAVATIVLGFLATLLLFLGGLLDGLFLGSTGALRAQRVDAIVYSSAARDSLLRSRIDSDLRNDVEAMASVGEVGGLGVVLLGGTRADEVAQSDEVLDVAVAGYEVPPAGLPEPPADGTAIADERLRSAGVSEGDVVLVGPAATPLTVVGFVDDTAYLLQGTMWVNLPTWRTVQNANRPDAAVADDVVQALVVRAAEGQSSDGLTRAIDLATNGATHSLSVDDAVYALPGVRQQESTFNQIIYSTLVVVLAVVGLFFSLLTLERIGLYGVLKAIGATDRRLFAGVVLQAAVVTVVAFVGGALLALLAAVSIPDGIPLQLTVGRFVFTFIGLLVAAVLGSALSLRRLTRIDPASAIGSGS